MHGFSATRRGWFVAVLALPFLAGCGSSGPAAKGKVNVSGKVTVDDQPLASGSITFTSLEGGRTAGGSIKDGLYSVDDVTPGKNKVLVTGGARPEMTANMAEQMGGAKWRKMVEEGRRNPQVAMKDAKQNMPVEITPGTVGNSQERVIEGSGKQTCDVTLISPKK